MRSTANNSKPGETPVSPLYSLIMTEFEKLVLEMRKAQRSYFKNRDKQSLELSKKLERQVDEYLSEKDKPTLFP